MTEVDRVVGQRIRSLRLARGLSQSELGVAVGVSCQQMQKYETGANRVSASRLLGIARALQQPVAVFFEGLEAGEPRPADLLVEARANALLRSFSRLTMAERRSVLAAMTDMIVEDPPFAAGPGAVS